MAEKSFEPLRSNDGKKKEKNMWRRNKYHNKKTAVDGVVFDSKAEARRYCELKLLQKAGEIKNLELQPCFLLEKAQLHYGKMYRQVSYIADFGYNDKKGNYVVEDVKGFRPAEYMVKVKWFLQKYGHLLIFKEL
ncbi:MAG: DUF1064 domain-containing protein [Endomicrobium sp.]|nr:DUF1064 domain-containing protein [Endomicrobium sp.]